MITALTLTVALTTSSLALSPADAVRAEAQRNIGVYTNEIPDITFTFAAWSEVCLQGSNIGVDDHVGTASTSGGQCAPGDLGFLFVENTGLNQRWEANLGQCWSFGMRLGHPGELYLADVAGVLTAGSAFVSGPDFVAMGGELPRYRRGSSMDFVAPTILAPFVCVL